MLTLEGSHQYGYKSLLESLHQAIFVEKIVILLVVKNFLQKYSLPLPPPPKWPYWTFPVSALTKKPFFIVKNFQKKPFNQLD